MEEPGTSPPSHLPHHPLPHTCQALVPGAPPSQPASLLVYELVLTAAVTMLGSVGPASTVVT